MKEVIWAVKLESRILKKKSIRNHANIKKNICSTDLGEPGLLNFLIKLWWVSQKQKGEELTFE